MQDTVERSKERDNKSLETKLKLLELEKKKEQQLKETLSQIQLGKQAQLDSSSKEPGLGLVNGMGGKNLLNGNSNDNKILNPVLKNVDETPVGPAAVASKAVASTNKTRLFSPKQKK